MSSFRQPYELFRTFAGFGGITFFILYLLLSIGRVHANDFNRLQTNSATITLHAFLRNDSSAVLFFNAKLYDWHGQLIASVYSESSNTVRFTNLSTNVSQERSIVPDVFDLYQNYPNPFNPTTHIQFEMERPSHVTLEIYKVLGQKIATILDDYFESGIHTTLWDGYNDHRQSVAGGVYFARLMNGTKQQLIKMIKADGNGGGQGTVFQKSLSKLADAPYTLIISPRDTLVLPDTIQVVLSGDTALNGYLKLNGRLLQFNFTDYFLNQNIDSVYVKTSLDSGLATPGSKFRASFGREDIIANGPRHLRSGIILDAGTLDTLFSHYLVNADTANMGLDTVYLKGLLTNYQNGGYRTSTEPKDGAYVGFTKESLKDTIWIYGSQLNGRRFRNVGQLNAMAEFFNDTARVITSNKRDTSGLFGIDKQIIAIADSNFMNPDSIAKFQYSNMRSVPQSLAPIDLETRKNYIIVLASSGSGGNARYFKDDGLTLKGGAVLTNTHYSRDGTMQIMNEEAGAMFLGSVESAISYPSLYDIHQNSFFPQDIRRQQWIVFRCPGRMFPDLPNGFNPK